MSSANPLLIDKMLFLVTALCLLAFPIAVAGFRLELWGFGISFKLLQIAFFASILLVLVGLFLLIKSWLGQGATTPYLLILALALIPVVGLGSQAVKARSLPMIHDITTDLTNPPAFEKIIALRGAKSNPLDRANEQLAQLQQAAYPEVTTISSDLNRSQAITRATEVAKQMGWKVVNTDSEQGLVEAVVTSNLFAFKDDVVVRVQDRESGGTRVDLRSVSRIGRSDLGANAARISAFIEQF